MGNWTTYVEGRKQFRLDIAYVEVNNWGSNKIKSQVVQFTWTVFYFKTVLICLRENYFIDFSLRIDKTTK